MRNEGGTMITMHPGEYLQASYMEPHRLTQKDLAASLGVSTAAVSRLLAGKSDLSPEMAVRLQLVFGRSAESWMSMQTSHSLALARAALDPALVRPIFLGEKDAA
jgi:addiction module HigA family antidote